MSSGEKHQVKHPEFVIVSPGRLVIVDPVTDRMASLTHARYRSRTPFNPPARQGRRRNKALLAG